MSREAPAPHPFDFLPRLHRQRIEPLRALRHGPAARAADQALGWLREALGGDLKIGSLDLKERASGLQRPGLFVTWHWASRGTAIGLSLETSLAHALVDRLLGAERAEGEAHRQLSPVEWGVLTYVVRRTTAHLVASMADAETPDLVLDRVGPDPFRPEPGRPYSTLVCPLRIGSTTGLARVWLPEGAIQSFEPAADSPEARPERLHRFRAAGVVLTAEAATATLTRGLARLRVGGVVPLDGRPLSGTPQAPAGPLKLVARTDLPPRAFEIAARLRPERGGAGVEIVGRLQSHPLPLSREVRAMTDQPESHDLPVTLSVELGRVGLSLERLADLKPGDILNLSRHSREPVELTSNGRAVARGELVQIDTELGVRITRVLL